MLMIDRIELILTHQIEQIGKFESGDARRLEQRGDAGNEIVDVRNMRQHVVGDDEVRLPALAGKLGRKPLAEEGLDDVDAFLPRRRGVLLVGSIP